MRPAIADQTVGGGGVSVDWMRMSDYAASGVYTSPVYDAGAVVNWQVANWVADVAPGTTVVVQVRTGSTATPSPTLTSTDTTWTPWTTVTTPGGAIDATNRYVQYKLTLSSTVANAAPAVKEVDLSFVR